MQSVSQSVKWLANLQPITSSAGFLISLVQSLPMSTHSSAALLLPGMKSCAHA